jgi:hypothetical protein
MISLQVPINHRSAGPPVLPLHAATSEAVFFGSLSAEQPLGGNISGLLLYCLILSLQDLWSNTQDNKLQLVQPCCLVWQLSASLGRRKLCLHAFECWPDIFLCCKVSPHLLLHNVVCPLQFYTSGRSAYVLRKAIHFHCQGMLPGILWDDWHALFMLSGWSCLLNWHITDLFSLSHFI